MPTMDTRCQSAGDLPLASGFYWRALWAASVGGGCDCGKGDTQLREGWESIFNVLTPPPFVILVLDIEPQMQTLYY